jgi:hypothetical protein
MWILRLKVLVYSFLLGSDDFWKMPLACALNFMNRVWPFSSFCFSEAAKGRKECLAKHAELLKKEREQ